MNSIRRIITIGVAAILLTGCATGPSREELARMQADAARARQAQAEEFQRKMEETKKVKAEQEQRTRSRLAELCDITEVSATTKPQEINVGNKISFSMSDPNSSMSPKAEIQQSNPKPGYCFLFVKVSFPGFVAPEGGFSVSTDDIVVLAGDGQKYEPLFYKYYVAPGNVLRYAWSGMWVSVGLQNPMPLLYTIPSENIERARLIAFGREIPISVKKID